MGIGEGRAVGIGCGAGAGCGAGFGSGDGVGKVVGASSSVGSTVSLTGIVWFGIICESIVLINLTPLPPVLSFKYRKVPAPPSTKTPKALMIRKPIFGLIFLFRSLIIN